MNTSPVNEVRGVLIQVAGHPLLLPNAATVEVLSYGEPDRIEYAPDWLLGRIRWRGWRLPLVAFSTLAGSQADRPGVGSKVVVLKALGEDPNVVVTVDRIKLVNPDPQQLEKGTDGMIRMKDGQPVEADAAVRVTSGFLETSNVNAVAEMTSMLALARQFELHVKMMRTAEEDGAAAARILQIS